jgi:hypothetical protein
MTDVVEVIIDAPVVVEILAAPTEVIEATSIGPQGPQGPSGPQGPQGIAGQGSIRFDISTPNGTWVVAHGLSRVPAATVYLATGEMALADVTADPTHVTVTFAEPHSGFVLLV